MNKDFKKLYEDIIKSEWFKKAYHNKSLGDCPFVIDELEESEDERIRKELMVFITQFAPEHLKVKYMAWLEKQKENPENADSIPADCVSDVKCENRWYKTANSLPDTGRDVLAKDAIGNYLLASFDGAQWFVSVYDGEDHPVLHTPPILEWCDIPLCHHDVNEIYRKGVRAGIEIANCNEQKEQKPAEWSEEDEYRRENLLGWLDSLKNYIHYDAIVSLNLRRERIDKICELEHWLKSLRPSWKPSKEQMEALKNIAYGTYQNGDGPALRELYEQLKKLKDGTR